MSISNTVRNQGTGTSASSYAYFYLSADTTIDSTDTYLGSRSIGSVSGGTSSSATTSLKIPVSTIAGTYYIVAAADATNTNPESDEANNTAATSAITITYGIDLIVSSLSGPSSAATNTNISVSNTVKNQGTVTSATSYVKFYLSTDTNITDTDIYLGQRSINALSGGASSSAATSLNIPATVAEGTYYIGAIADATNTNLESDEANNTAVTAALVVTAP